MNNSRVYPFVITIALISTSFSASVGNLTIAPYLAVFGQSLPSSPTTVQITKDSSNSYKISSGSSEIGEFDTSYTILGNIETIKNEQKLIISTITNDFNNSPVIGYIKISPTSSQQQQQKQQEQTTLSNPFADKATINQKIETEINNALSSAGNPNTPISNIQCHFGMNISEWNCKNQGSVG